jgi:hypothetical protein
MAHPSATPASADMKRKNLRLGLILGSVAAVFFAGFVLKMILLGQSH